MSKAPSPFKMTVPGVTSRRPAEPVPATEQVAEQPTKPARTSVPPGCKSLTFYPSKDAWLQLRNLAGRTDRPIIDHMLEAMDDYLVKHGLIPNARVPKGEEAA
jgi:hypothetical protein